MKNKLSNASCSQTLRNLWSKTNQSTPHKNQFISTLLWLILKHLQNLAIDRTLDKKTLFNNLRLIDSLTVAMRGWWKHILPEGHTPAFIAMRHDTPLLTLTQLTKQGKVIVSPFHSHSHAGREAGRGVGEREMAGWGKGKWETSRTCKFAQMAVSGHTLHAGKQ